MKIKAPNLRVRFSNWLRMRRFRKEQWHHWFAWYPVRTEFVKFGGQYYEYVWLEKVRRKYIRVSYFKPGHSGDWIYRSTDSFVERREINW
jgi:hypothetical protein